VIDVLHHLPKLQTLNITCSAASTSSDVTLHPRGVAALCRVLHHLPKLQTLQLRCALL
jgi:hypothetical protein